MPAPKIIGVSGLQGSGKSTLAKGLAKVLGWTYIAESETAARYIPELFHQMDRFAFEAQVGFLCKKAVMILESLSAGRNVIVDRTLYEDWHVFARYFRNINKIDERAYNTYVVLAQYFTEEIPPPALTVLCECSLPVAKERIDVRKKEYHKYYPANHLEDLQKLYEEWLGNYDVGPLVSVNSEVENFLDEAIVRSIAEDISTLFRSPESAHQLDLFSRMTISDSVESLKIIKAIRGVEKIERSVISVPGEIRQSVFLPEGRFAYIAAPFTQLATESARADGASKEQELLSLAAPHGEIRTGDFRRALLGIARSLKAKKFDSLIPHRDVNFWGRKTVPPSEVFTSCSLSIHKAELVVAVLGTSAGAHYEVGLARGLGKPLIIIHCDEMPPSYIAQGMFSDDRLTLVTKCRSLREIPHVFNSPDVNSFIEKVCL